MQLLKEHGCRLHKCAITGEQLIPKVIYRTWRTTTLPKTFQTAWDVTMANNPEYKQLLYSDADVEEFMRQYAWSDLYEAFRSINPKYGAARADIFRYLLLYVKGGIYLDIKSIAHSLCTLIKPGDGLLLSKWEHPTGQIKYLCSGEIDIKCRHGEYQQWWIISRKGHPALRHVLNEICKTMKTAKNSEYPPGKDSVLRLTGPTLYTRALDALISEGMSDYRFVCANGNDILEYSVANDYTTHTNNYGADKVHYSKVTDDLLGESVCFVE